MVSIQGGAALAKSLFPRVGADGATALRLAFAALLLLAWWRPWRQSLDRKGALLVALYGAALGAMNLMFYRAIASIPLGLAVALEFTGPLALALIASRRLLDFVWVGLAGAGILLLAPIAPRGGALDLLGVAFALGAGACWALYIVFGQRAGAAQGGRATSLGMCVAAVLVVPVGVANAGSALLSADLLPAALGVGILSSALPYSLEMAAMRRLRAATFGVLMSLEPAVAALSGLWFLGERLTLTQSAAIACVMLASFGSAATARAVEAVALAG